MYRRNKNTLFGNCIYSVFTFYFFIYRYALQQASQIRQPRFKISPNKFRSVSNCFNTLMQDGNEISSINFKIVSLNVRGLNNSIKRRKVFKWLHRQTAPCYFLQETFSTEQSINIWRSEWGGNIFYSHGSNHSKGVMILVNPRYQFEVIRSIKDKNGRSIILEIKLDNQNLALANVYAPNDISQQIKFYQDLNQTLSGFSDCNLIIGGGFNCALTPKDRKSVKQRSNKPTVINEIEHLCSNFALTDIWRELNPQALSFTWHDQVQVSKPTRFFPNHS